MYSYTYMYMYMYTAPCTRTGRVPTGRLLPQVGRWLPRKKGGCAVLSSETCQHTSQPPACTVPNCKWRTWSRIARKMPISNNIFVAFCSGVVTFCGISVRCIAATWIMLFRAANLLRCMSPPQQPLSRQRATRAHSKRGTPLSEPRLICS